MKIFGLSSPLFEVEGSQTNIGADIAELEVEEIPENEEEIEVNNPEENQEEEEVAEETSKEEEEEEQEEEVEEEEETSEQNTEIFHPFERPSIKQLTESFPELFKKFPSLKDMYFREAEFTKIFPTITDAKEAAENNTAFANIRSDVIDGDGSKFLSAIKETGDKNLERFSRKFLPSLLKIHPNAFWQSINPLIEDLSRQMFEKGTKENNENVQNAARVFSLWFFGDVDFAEGKKTSVVREEDQPSEVKREREAWDNERQTEFRGKIDSDLKTQLISIIVGKNPKTGKTRIDPDEVLSPFIRSTIIDYIIKDLDGQLGADKDHLKYMDNLWEHAKKNGRTDAEKARIVSAYLARAKAMIPSLRSKYVSEAMGRKTRDADQRREKVSQIRERGNNTGRPSGQRSKDLSRVDYSKTSDLDILNDNITYK